MSAAAIALIVIGVAVVIGAALYVTRRPPHDPDDPDLEGMS